MNNIICIFLDLLSDYSHDYKIKFNLLLLAVAFYALYTYDFEFLLEVLNIAIKFNCHRPTE